MNLFIWLVYGTEWPRVDHHSGIYWARFVFPNQFSAQIGLSQTPIQYIFQLTRILFRTNIHHI